jgi:hypothetical protein
MVVSSGTTKFMIQPQHDPGPKGGGDSGDLLLQRNMNLGEGSGRYHPDCCTAALRAARD